MKRQAPASIAPHGAMNLASKPTPKGFVLALIFAGAAAALLVLPFLAPLPFAKPVDGRTQSLSVAQSMKSFVLSDALHSGLFRSTARSTDTLPSDSAAFLAVATASAVGVAPKDVFVGAGYDRLIRRATARLADAVAEKLDLEDSFYAIATARLLSLPGVAEDAGVEYAKKLATPDGAFRLSEKDFPSLEGIFWAVEVLAASHAANGTEAPLNTTSAVVLYLQDRMTGGFRNIPDSEPTMLDTYRAVRTLVHLRVNDSDPVFIAGLRGAVNFVGACRAADGGFFPAPRDRRSAEFSQPSSAAVTAMGLYVATVAGLFIDVPSAAVNPAKDYLAASFRLDRGIVEAPMADAKTSLVGSFLFAELRRIPNFELTIQTAPWVAVSARWAAIACLCAAAVAWFSPLMHTALLRKAIRNSAVLLCLLGGATAVLVFFPAAALPAFLAVFAFAIPMYYNAQLEDEGTMSTVMSIEAFLFLALVIGLQTAAPYVFASADVFLLLALWGFVASFLVSYASGYFIGRWPGEFHVNCAVLAWVASMVGLTVLLFAKDISLTYRLLAFRGQRVAIIVVFPVVLYALMQLGAGLGFALYSGPAAAKLSVRKLMSMFTPKAN